MIDLFYIPKYIVDFSLFKNVINDPIVEEFEKQFSIYVGADYSCGVNSCTNAITLVLEWLKFQNKLIHVEIPTMIPIVVVNAVIHADVSYKLIDNSTWMGNEYKLAYTDSFTIYDSAQAISKDRLFNKGSDFCVLYSFYPTKPVSGIDGGMISTNNRDLYMWLKEAVMNGTTSKQNSWERQINFPGWKSYLSSVQAYVAMNSLERIDEKKRVLKEVRDLYNLYWCWNRKDSDHLYQVLLPSETSNRITVEKLKRREVVCGIHYDCVHKVASYIEDRSLPVSEEVSKRVLSIPFHEKLTEEELAYVHTEIINLY